MQRNNRWGGYYNFTLGMSFGYDSRPEIRYDYITRMGGATYVSDSCMGITTGGLVRFDWGIGFSRKR